MGSVRALHNLIKPTNYYYVCYIAAPDEHRCFLN
jgi:hypothetical protein